MPHAYRTSINFAQVARLTATEPSALSRAHPAGKLGIPTFRLPGKRGTFATLADVERVYGAFSPAAVEAACAPHPAKKRTWPPKFTRPHVEQAIAAALSERDAEWTHYCHRRFSFVGYLAGPASKGMLNFCIGAKE